MKPFRLEMFRGDAESFDVRAFEPDEVTPLNLTGADLRFTGKRRITNDNDDDAVIVCTTGDGTISFVNATLGIARIDVPPSQTDSLTRDTVLLCDLQITDIADKPRTLADGTLLVRRDVSRTTP